jgi:hypothetical protein
MYVCIDSRARLGAAAHPNKGKKNSFLASSVAGPAGEGNNVADVFHTSGKEDEALEPETKPRVHARAIPVFVF